jgi:hypothetical protein
MSIPGCTVVSKMLRPVWATPPLPPLPVAVAVLPVAPPLPAAPLLLLLVAGWPVVVPTPGTTLQLAPDTTAAASGGANIRIQAAVRPMRVIRSTLHCTGRAMQYASFALRKH